MNKTIKWMVIAAALMVTAVAVVGIVGQADDSYADPEYEAETGGVQYATLAEAISAAESGGTVTLLKDCVYGDGTQYEFVFIGKNLTINGDGHDITMNATRADITANVSFSNLGFIAAGTDNLFDLSDNDVTISFTACGFSGNSSVNTLNFIQAGGHGSQVFSGDIVIHGCSFDMTGDKVNRAVRAVLGTGGSVEVNGCEFTGIGGDRDTPVKVSGADFATAFTADDANAQKATMPDDPVPMSLSVTDSFKVLALTYTVNFNSNGGSEVPSIQNVYAGAKIVAPTAPTKDNNTFGGWYKEAGLQNEWLFDTDTVRANITLYAKWVPDTYTVTIGPLSASYGHVDVGTVPNVPAGSKITVNGNKITVNGVIVTATPADPTVQQEFEFYKWVVGEVELQDQTPVNSDMTITAEFSTLMRHYTITFLNYDDSPVWDYQPRYGETIMFLGENPTRPADEPYTFDFIGWNQDKAATSGADLGTVYGAETFYAIYLPQTNVAKIVDDYTGTHYFTTLEGAIDNIILCGSNIILIGDATVTGARTITDAATINGQNLYWIKIDGVDIKVDTDFEVNNVTGLTFDNGGRLLIKVSYDLNYEGSPDASVVYSSFTLDGSGDPNGVYTLPDSPTRSGYAFRGWFTQPTGGTQVTSQTVLDNTSAHTLYAQWDQAFTVTLTPGEGYTLAAKEGSSSPVASGGSFTFTFALDTAYSKSTAVVKVNGSAVTLTNGEYTIENITADQTVTVEGVTINTYTVLFKALPDGYGTVSQGSVSGIPHGSTVSISGNTLTLNGTTITATPAAATAEYTYVFSTWSVGDGYEITFTNYTINATFQQTITEYAITLDTSGNGTIDPTSIAAQAYGTAYSVNGAVLTIGDRDITATADPETPMYIHSFDGWYIGENKITAVSTITGETTFTAKFTSVAYVARVGDVSYMTFEEAFAVAQNDDVITLLADCTVTSPLTLKNKNIGIDGSFTVTIDGVEFDLTGQAEITLTNGANIVAVNSGSIHIDTLYKRNYDPPSNVEVGQVYTPGAKYILPTNNPTRDGYQFNGWWTESEGGTQVTSNTEMELAAKYFYAHWNQLFTVTLTSGEGYTLAAKAGSSSPVASGGSFTFTFALDTAYSKSTAVVKVNGSVVTLSNGEYTIENITEDKTVTVEGVTINTYSVTYDITNGPAIAADTAIYGQEFVSAVITANEHYLLPAVVNLEKDGQGYTNFTYSKSAGTVTIPAVGVTGDFVIRVSCEPEKLGVMFSVSPEGYGSLSKSVLTGVPYGTAVSLNGNVLTINGTNITASPADSTVEYVYSFVSWSVTDGYKITSNGTTITASFTRAASVAKIGNSYYASFSDAVAAVENGQTIELLTDCTYAPGDGHNIQTSFNVNGGDHKLTMGSSLINFSYPMTFTDVKFVADDLENNMFDITVSTSITFTGCEFSGNCSSSVYLMNFIQVGSGYVGTLTISGCTFDMTGDNVNRAVRVVLGGTNGKVIVNNSTFIGAGNDKDTPVKVSGTGYDGALTGTGNVQKATASAAAVDLSIVTENEASMLKYVIPTFTVSFVSNDTTYGTVSLDSIADVPYDTVITVNGNKVTINGTDVTATAAPETEQYVFAFGSWSVQDGAKVTGAMTITATFIPQVKQYTVTIAGEGVTVKNGTVTVNSGDKVDYGADLTATIAARTGYIGSITPGTSYTVVGDVTFTGAYAPITYTIAFDANGGTGDMAALAMTYDVEKVLAAVEFARADYAFGGWATAAAGAAVYSDKATVLNLTTEDGATVTLYAVWIQVEKKDNTAEVIVTTNEVSDQAAQAVIDAAKDIAATGSQATAEMSTTATDDLSVKSDYIKEAAEAGVGVNLGTKSGSLELSSEALTNLGIGNDAVIKAEFKTIATPEEYKKELDQNAIVFSVTLTNNDVAYTNEFGTFFTVKLAYTPAAGVDTSKLKVMYLAGDGTLEEMTDGHYADGYMVFTTNHLSSFAIVDGSSSGGGSGSDSNWVTIAFILVFTVLLIVLISAPVFASKFGKQ